MDQLRVLVAYARVHRATAEIARSIARTLRRAGIDIDVIPVDSVEDVSGYLS